MKSFKGHWAVCFLLVFAMAGFSNSSLAGKNAGTKFSYQPLTEASYSYNDGSEGTPIQPGNISSEQACIPRLDLDDVVLEIPVTGNGKQTAAEPANYPWAIKAQRTRCNRKTCIGRCSMATAGTTTIGASIPPLLLSSLTLAASYSLIHNSPGAYYTFWSSYAVATLSCFSLIVGGILRGIGSVFSSDKDVGAVYSCNHRECIQSIQPEPPETAEGLLCPGNNINLLRYPVMISGYDKPLSLEFVMECIRDKTPFPADTSRPVTWSRLKSWKSLSTDQKQTIKDIYARSQVWLSKSNHEIPDASP